MSKICGLKTESSLPEQSHESTGCSPISMLVFLQAENRKLRDAVAQLQRDTMTLREAFLKNSSCPPAA